MFDSIENIKQKKIIQTGKELFWKFGIKRVTIEEVCKRSEVSKMTFYKFFPNKAELAKTIWRLVVDTSLQEFQDIVNSSLPFEEKVTQLFTLKLQSTKDISLEFLNDIYALPELGLLPLIEESTRKSFSIFVDFLRDSQSKGFIRKEIKIEFILYYFNHMSKIMEDDALVSKYDHPQDLIMENMNFLFYGLSPKK